MLLNERRHAWTPSGLSCAIVASLAIAFSGCSTIFGRGRKDPNEFYKRAFYAGMVASDKLWAEELAKGKKLNAEEITKALEELKAAHRKDLGL